jgi:hypothetical protein
VSQSGSPFVIILNEQLEALAGGGWSCGFFVIDVPDLDTALEWAARYPGKVVEVRPNIPPVE